MNLSPLYKLNKIMGGSRSVINVLKGIPIWQVLLKQNKNEEERETITAVAGKQCSPEQWGF